MEKRERRAGVRKAVRIKSTLAFEQKIKKSGKLPLDYMLEVMGERPLRRYPPRIEIRRFFPSCIG
jgi:hypothetical protein